MTHVFLAGIRNSEPGHWQRIWYESLPGSVWLEHRDWLNPDRDEWVAELDVALGQLAGPALVIAHSLGCLLLAEWAQQRDVSGVAGAFLVAVPDVDGPAFPGSLSSWRSALEMPLTLPALLVASEDDPYAGIDFARQLTEHWLAGLANAGRLGHINAQSGIGAWEGGRRLLAAFAASIEETSNAI